ncbi:MAG TPA: YkgJ family cysteine cluster protein [Chitinophagaceae bacterium]|nr:YkgJ family cysteine cluster protein [Chitinophagaceae bacterium]
MSKLLRNFKIQLPQNQKKLVQFLKKFDTQYVKGLQNIIAVLEKETWNEVDCLECANCCKVMTPTFTNEDIKRISSYVNMNENEFTDKWLKVEEESKDVVNKIQPCQFLNLETNKCTIYEVRPADCREFPHFKRKPFGDYNHVHEQNIEYCPATFKLIAKLKKRIEKDYEW